MKNSLLLLLCFALVLSCKKDNNSSPGSSGGTTTPTTSAVCGNGSFSANGTTISHNGLMPNNECHPSGLGMIGTDIGSVNANLVSYNNNSLVDYTLVVALGGFDIVTGVTYTAASAQSLNFTYNVNSPSGSLQSSYSNMLIDMTTGNIQFNGEVTFTKLDPIDSLISGTFSFTGYDVFDPTNTVAITNGTFQDLPCQVM